MGYGREGSIMQCVLISQRKMPHRISRAFAGVESFKVQRHIKRCKGHLKRCTFKVQRHLTLRLFNGRLMTEVAKFGLLIGQLTYFTYKKFEFTSLNQESRARKSQCKRTLLRLVYFAHKVCLLSNETMFLEFCDDEMLLFHH